MSAKYTEFSGLNLPAIEKEILAKWKDGQAFEQSVSLREGKTPFVFYEGPPSANGMPGIHHVISRTLKDMVCRYKTMQGFQVKRKGGWDTHGLPVELGVEKELGRLTFPEMPCQAGFKGCEGKKYRGGKVKCRKSKIKSQKSK